MLTYQITTNTGCWSMLLSCVQFLPVSFNTDVQFDPVEDTLRDQRRAFDTDLHKLQPRFPIGTFLTTSCAFITQHITIMTHCQSRVSRPIDAGYWYLNSVYICMSVRSVCRSHNSGVLWTAVRIVKSFHCLVDSSLWFSKWNRRYGIPMVTTLTVALNIAWVQNIAFRDRRPWAPARGGAGWASAHPGKNQGEHGPPWKF